ncbi:acyl-CoA dehydrogenase/oxidase [Aspergillus lucknowensis]|uniref:Acyl-CoA dehydrogenase/oxidase n=1 Tax=Aspergillus lucknowensis TaxID=176173 RepID=A0ABR4LIM5_9EURO
MPSLTPSTADEGYFLTLPPLGNPAETDAVYQRMLEWHLPPHILSTVKPRLSQFAAEAISDQVNAWIGNAETQQPYVKSRNVWGARYDRDRLVTSEGWKKLGKWGLSNGIVAIGYEDTFGQHRRIVQHAFNYIYSAASAAYSCPVSMTSGACRLVRHHLEVPQDHPFHYLYSRLTSRDEPWISAQWMTERVGGSDVRNSETVAVYSPLPSKTGQFGRIDEGDYLLSGFKFFSSATDCNVAFILAKTESGELSLFVAPTLKRIVDDNGKEKEVTNGIHIHRLKNKFGTKELPTAELELRDVRAHIIGPKDRGIATVALLLNVTRTHNFITALSCLRRAMEIAKGFARARTTIDQPLWTFPMHLRTLAQMEVKHRGWMHLAFFTTSLLSYADHGFPSDLPSHYKPLAESTELATLVLRALTSTSKAVICKSATLAFQECQEAMGGVGYIDEPEEPEFNVSRLWRDTSSNAVWEGTSNVLASETVRHLTRGGNLKAFGRWIQHSIVQVRNPASQETLRKAWEALSAKLDTTTVAVGLPSVLANGRQIMFTLAWLVSGILLALDAQRDGNVVANEVAGRWVLEGEGIPQEFCFADIIHLYWKISSNPVQAREIERRNWDCRIVWGVDLPRGASAGYRVQAKI